MDMYRIVVIEPESGICLHHEQSADYEGLYARFSAPTDTAYLYQVAKAYPEAKSVLFRIDYRGDQTDWAEICSRVEFLP